MRWDDSGSRLERLYAILYHAPAWGGGTDTADAMQGTKLLKRTMELWVYECGCYRERVSGRDERPTERAGGRASEGYHPSSVTLALVERERVAITIQVPRRFGVSLSATSPDPPL